MRRYFIFRLLQVLPVLWGVSLVVFMVVRLIPGDPATAMLSSRATPALIREARAQLHLNGPIWSQYVSWLGSVLRGNFGVSFFYSQSVTSLVVPRIGVTLELLAYSSLLAIGLTFPIATLAALGRDRGIDQSIRVGLAVTLGMPSFWLGILLALLLGVDVKLFPVAGGGSGFGGTIYHLTLPAVTIALSMLPLQVRALRSGLIEVLNADYVTTARACGLKRRFLVRSYLWRNSLIPVVTTFTVTLGWMIGSTVVVEQVYAVPGLGSMLVGSLSTRDYSVVQFVALILALLIVMMNLLTDVAYAVVDPRVRFN